MTICFFGIYDRNYSRNRVILKGLRENNIKVIECQDSSQGLIKYFKLIYKFFKIKENYDYLWVAFPGQWCVILIKLFTRKKIIFDAFTSHYQGLVEDRQVVSKDSLLAKIYFWLDQKSCQLADIVILDTNEHIDYFVRNFNLSKKKFFRLFVGSDDSIFFPRTKEQSEKFMVHWHGHYIPLQGAEVIIEAVNILKENKDIIFNMIGRGQEFFKIKELSEKFGLNNVNFINNVKYQDLAEWQSKADVCLGIFGKTLKAGLVIPNKAYEALAMAKPLITEKSRASVELLTDQENVIFCQASEPKDLADKIIQLKNNQSQAKKIGENGYQLFKKKLTPEILIKNLLEKINVNFN